MANDQIGVYLSYTMNVVAVLFCGLLNTIRTVEKCADADGVFNGRHAEFLHALEAAACPLHDRSFVPTVSIDNIFDPSSREQRVLLSQVFANISLSKCDNTRGVEFSCFSRGSRTHAKALDISLALDSN